MKGISCILGLINNYLVLLISNSFILKHFKSNPMYDFIEKSIKISNFLYALFSFISLFNIFYYIKT